MSPTWQSCLFARERESEWGGGVRERASERERCQVYPPTPLPYQPNLGMIYSQQGKPNLLICMYVCMCRCVVSCVCACVRACVCLTQRWLTNHLEARCRLENYFLSSLLPSLQSLLVPLVNPWTLTSVLWHGCVSLGLCVCLPGWVNGEVATFPRGHERSLRDLWSSSALTDPVPTQTASVVLHPSPCRSAPPLSDQSIEERLLLLLPGSHQV